MSISSSVRKAGPFAGNDIQTVFAFAFKVFDTTDVLATQAVGSVETVLTLGVDYGVALNSDQDAAPGGIVALTTALATGATLVLTSDVDQLQPVVVTNGGGFFPAVFNGVFDKLTILIQQLYEKLSRAMVVPITSSVTNLTIPVSPSTVLQWNAAGDALVAQPLPDLALSLALPAQGGNVGKFLQTNGTTPAWVDVPAATVSSVAGLTGSISTGALKAALGYDTGDLPNYTVNTTTIATSVATSVATTIAAALIASLSRPRLSGNLTYYVRTDGSDANTGLVNNAGGAFLTLQKAIDTALALDFNGYTVTLQLATGSYPGAAQVSGLAVGQKRPQDLLISGNTGTPSNVVLNYAGSGAQTVALRATYGGKCAVQGVKFSNNAGNLASIQATLGGEVDIVGACEFGTSNYQLYAHTGGIIRVSSSYSVVAGATSHLRAESLGKVYFEPGGTITVTVTGTPAMSGAFASAYGGAYIETNSTTFSGAATGTRYSASVNGVLNTPGGGASYFPGNSAGSTATGGQYV